MFNNRELYRLALGPAWIMWLKIVDFKAEPRPPGTLIGTSTWILCFGVLVPCLAVTRFSWWCQRGVGCCGSSCRFYPLVIHPSSCVLLSVRAPARYLSQQIVPPVSRLCEPIEGTSLAILAEKMGLDASKFTSHVSGRRFRTGLVLRWRG